jgi:hypothetical protein
VADDPLRQWTDVPEWSGEIECLLSDNYPIFNLSGTDSVGAYHYRGVLPDRCPTDASRVFVVRRGRRHGIVGGAVGD